MKLSVFFVAVMAVVIAGLFGNSTTASATHVNPVLEDPWSSGNAIVECNAIGYPYGFKRDDPTIENGAGIGDGMLINYAFNQAGNTVIWSSKPGIDAVVMKASTVANVYYYDPESTGDTGLDTPTAEQNGNLRGISHITFCWDRELTVTKTVDSVEYTRDHNWDIEKTVSPASHDLFVGESGASTYSISVTELPHTDRDFVVTGGITVSNPWHETAGNVVITDVIAPVDCGAFTGILISGAAVDCTYASAPVANAIDLPAENVAYTTADYFEIGSATAPIVPADPTTENDAIVTVADVNDSQSPRDHTSAIAGFSYDVVFNDCVRDSEGVYTGDATHLNTAYLYGDSAIVPLGSASQLVSIECHEIGVSKTVDSTSLTRTTEWTIAKSVVDQTGDSDGLYGITADQFLVLNYTVDVTGTPLDSDHAVHGEITVSNPHPTRDITVDVVDNGLSFGSVLVESNGGNSVVSYSVPGNPTGGTNVASASYSLTTGGDAIDSAGVDYSFDGAAVSLVDNSANVSDDQTIDGATSTSPISELVSAGADGDFSGSWSYVTSVGPYDCGASHTVDNVASVAAITSGLGGTATVNAVINVAACDGGDGGYTLTPGYWKTHSMTHNDGRHYDNTWDSVGPLGENELYIDPAYTWIEIMWVNDGGNAYVKLSRAYIAATLNGLNGADTTAVDAELAWAANWLANNTVDGVGSLKGKAKKAAQEAVQVAGILDDYNNGIIGPGHGNF